MYVYTFAGACDLYRRTQLLCAAEMNNRDNKKTVICHLSNLGRKKIVAPTDVVPSHIVCRHTHAR